ncbi:Transmembrane protein [Trema orientale]|uniref:Transmembrane protein n=1 Tax=Trema orientale TaxID=63057 RepID=A0A2P5FJ97_TREOI|nr:Transmembrane protein [Trema orientale]
MSNELEEPYLLQYVDDIPFAETPLHVAIRFGHFHFAVEILKLKPSFCRRPNQEGLYPIHLATKNGHNCKILQRLLAVDGGDLVRLPWREDKTPLHLAAEQGDVHLLRMLLSACPLSILDVTIRNETALHITLKENKLDAFHCLLRQLRTALHEGSKEQEKKILNSKDEEGNTLLHIATRNNYPQVVRVLLSCGVKVNAKNSVGSAALDVAQGDSHKAIRQMLTKAKPSRTITSSDHHQGNNIQRSELSFVDRTVLSLMRYKRDMSMEVRSLLLVVSVLIATVVYEAALDPPTIKDDRAKNNNVSLLLNIMAMTNSSSNTHNYTVSFSNINGSRNSTTSSRIHALLGDTSYTTILFWTSNILALSSSVLTVFAILPSEYIHSVLFVPLYGFSLCYVVSTAFTGSLLWFVITLVLLKVLPGGLLYVYRVSFRFKPSTY